jgi:hypothetical protein
VVVPALASIQWETAFRIIATRFPAVDLWEGLGKELWARLDQVEALTSARLQAPAEGTESAYVQWPFSNPRPGRFSTATQGAFYAAREEPAAIAETMYYQALRCREDRLAPHDFDMRVLTARLEGTFHDVRGRRARPFPHLMDPGSHAASRFLAEDLATRGSQGVVFDSVRDPAHGPCVAAFTPAVVQACRHLRYLTYRWTGSTVAVLYEKRPYPA